MNSDHRFSLCEIKSELVCANDLGTHGNRAVERLPSRKSVMGREKKKTSVIDHVYFTSRDSLKFKACNIPTKQLKELKVSKEEEIEAKMPKKIFCLKKS